MTENIFAHEHPESDRAREGGFTLWFTGLSGSGKTTIAHLVGPELDKRGCFVEYMDGDTVRTHLSKGLGFSKEDRDTNIRRIGFVANLLARNGCVAITAAISPYREIRDEVRKKTQAAFVEVYVEASLDVLEERDTKGLYKKARAGIIKNFTGVSDPYEAPVKPEVAVHTADESIEESAEKILAYLKKRGLLKG
jgi:adenylylsulfate kinase